MVIADDLRMSDRYVDVGKGVEDLLPFALDYYAYAFFRKV